MGGNGLRNSGCSGCPNWVLTSRTTPTTKPAKPGAMTPAPVRENQPPSLTPAPMKSSPKSANPTPSMIFAVSGDGEIAELPRAAAAAISNRKAVRASKASGRLTISSACQAPAMLTDWSAAK